MKITVSFERECPSVGAHKRVFRLTVLQHELRLLGEELDVLLTGPARRTVFDGYYLVMGMDWSLSWTNVADIGMSGRSFMVASDTTWHVVSLDLRHFIKAIRKVEAGSMKPDEWGRCEFTYDTETGKRASIPPAVCTSATALLRRCEAGWPRQRLAQSLNSFRKALRPDEWARLLAQCGRCSSIYGVGPDEIGFTVWGMSGAHILRGDEFSSHT